MHTLSDIEVSQLRKIIGTECAQLVWDLHAVYFVQHPTVTAVEAVADSPISADPMGEVMHVRVAAVSPAPRFVKAGEPGFWYKVLAERVRIESIDVVRTAVTLPAETIAHPSSAPRGAFIADCGVLVRTPLGVLPAVQMEDIFGFYNWSSEPPRWYTDEEVRQNLGPSYEVRHVGS